MKSKSLRATSKSPRLRVGWKDVSQAGFVKAVGKKLGRMAKEVDRYTYRVTWSEDDQEHVGLCAEFPSLSWLGNSPENALKGIRKLVKSCIADMKKSNEKIPEPLNARTQTKLRML